MRLHKACTLLQNTDWTVSRIAKELGYESVNYFYRQFKKHIGITPSDYRKNHGL